MKIAVVTSFTEWPPNLETDLELIQTHLDRGDEVCWLTCSAVLPACDDNPTHEAFRCVACIGKRIAGAALLSQKVRVKSLFHLTEANHQEIQRLPTTFSSVDELKQLQVENFDLGTGVLSSLISQLRNPQPDLQQYANQVRAYLISALATYRSIQNFLATHPIDQVYIFNGRHGMMRAALRACQSRGVKCI